jgi:hypothetical protein
MRRISPGDSLSKITGNAEPLPEQIQNSSRFDCMHFAGAERLTQRQSGVSLCKNCGAEKLPVEGEGKSVILFD